MTEELQTRHSRCRPMDLCAALPCADSHPPPRNCPITIPKLAYLHTGGYYPDMQDYIREPARELPVVHEADICVVGGGCTGVFAAVRAARLGARVAIIEKQNCFGGVATAGGVNIWHSLYSTDGGRQIIGGLTQEVIERLARRGAVTGDVREAGVFAFNPEELKIELDELIIAHRVTPFLHTFYAYPALEEGRLRAVVVENKNGRQAIRAAQFVDATGDADLARSVGVPCRESGALQPPTMCAKIQGLSTLGDFNWTEALSRHGPAFGLEEDWGWGSAIPGLRDIQMRADTHVFNTDVSDADQLTRGEIEGRRKIRALLDILRQHGPPDSRVGLVALAATLGGREARRIAGRHTLTGDELLHGRRFPDAIANGTYPVDTHHADTPGITFRYLDGTERVIPDRHSPAIVGRWREPLPEDPTFYQIPFRSLVQDHVPNLVVAGRMLDADKVAFSAVRVMVNLNQTGEAAGVACVLAARQRCAIADVAPRQLRDLLAEGGSVIL